MDIVENLIQAVSILNKTEEYLESLPDRLSECDSLISDYEHLIENNDITEIDSKKLFAEMKAVLNKRRIVKNNLTLRDNYKNMVARLNNTTNREFFIHNMKTAQSKLGLKYHNRILTEEEVEQLKIIEITKKRGRPKKQEVI